MLYSLQYARAIAALFVVHAHLAGFPIYATFAPSGVGGLGVDIFFVISGYIMWHTARDMPAGRFVVRRLLRIVPVYWFYTLLLVGIALLLPVLAPRIEVTAQTVLGSLFFIPYRNAAGGVQPILQQGWTLNYEMFFYAVFALCLLLPKVQWRFAAIVATFAVLAGLGALFRPEGAVLATYTDSILMEFVFGIGLAALPARRVAPWLLVPVAAAGLVVLVLADLGAMHELPRFISHGLPAAGFIWALVGMESLVRMRPSRIVLALGDASYSLYLCHSFVLSAVAGLGRVAVNRGWLPDSAATSALLCAVAVLACCAAALVSYIVIERGLGKYLGSLINKRSGAPAAASTSNPLDSPRAG